MIFAGNLVMAKIFFKRDGGLGSGAMENPSKWPDTEGSWNNSIHPAAPKIGGSNKTHLEV